jgi:hypothetical protein
MRIRTTLLAMVLFLVTLAIIPIAPAMAQSRCGTFTMNSNVGPTAIYQTVSGMSCSTAHQRTRMFLYQQLPGQAMFAGTGWRAQYKQVLPLGAEDPMMRVTVSGHHQLLVFYLHY